MYTIFKKQIRESLNIPFYFEKHPTPTEYKVYFHANFVVNEKFISHEITYSEDKLTIIDKLVWSSRDAFLDYASDTFCYDMLMFPNKMYNIENSIATVISVEGVS